MKRILVANRGEIALRAVRAARKLGVASVAVCSDADRNSPHVWAADRSVCIGPPAAALSYLNGPALIEAARGSGCDAIYPGYGFLSEKSAFAAACREEGLIFIGPSPEAISLMGDKVEARRVAERNGVPVVPGSHQGFTNADHAVSVANEIGFPLLIKASGGGGGRGMRVVFDASEFIAQFTQASAEAFAAFGNAQIYMERFFARVRHVEIQVFGDRHGNAIHLWERDCSIQRRHQKLVEEAPSPVLDARIRLRMAEAATALIRNIDYEGAGTIEFIYDLDSGRWFFIEMNTRIQVEHPVTEMTTDVDLVKSQILIAAGGKLSEIITDHPVYFRGHAIECRINAEHPERFTPSAGKITAFNVPGGTGIRVDTAAYAEGVIPPYYDSLIAKLCARGRDRDEAISRMQRALDMFVVEGIHTSIPLHKRIMADEDFRSGNFDTKFMERFLAQGNNKVVGNK